MAKILIVDDEASIRNTLKEILEFEKYDVDEAMDGIQCLGKLKKSKYDQKWMGWKHLRECRQSRAILQ
jgi:two-component system nitrogen regulation response regulator NtrX